MESRKILFLNLAFVFLTSCQGNFFGTEEESQIGRAAEPANGFIQNVYGARVSWKNDTPVSLQVDSNFSPIFYSSAQVAADVWNSTAGRLLIRVSALPVGVATEPKQDSVSGLYWRTTWAANKRNQQALTTIFFSDNIIFEGDIKVNAQDFTFYTETPNSDLDVHMTSLLVHEFGHLLGLKHSEEPESVMWAWLGALLERLNITINDLTALKCEYK